jgi:hypothetical protein
MQVIDRGLLSPAGTSRRTPPANLSPADDAYFAHELVKPFPATRLTELSPALVTNRGVVLNALSVFGPSVSGGDLWRRSSVRYNLRTRIKQRRKRLRGSEPYLLAFDFEYLGYFHWLTETLARLHAMGNRTDSVVMLLPGNRLPFHEASLRSFTLGGFAEIGADEYVDVERLLMPTHTAMSGNYSNGLIRSLAHRLRRNLTSSDTPGARRIYISRRNAQKRRIANESEIVPLLERHGFRGVCFEDHPFEEQVAMSMRCEHMVGLHGAGLTNMLFMGAGSRVLELRLRGDHHNNAYFSLASALRVPYYYLLCEAVDSTDPHLANVHVDPEALDACLEKVTS